jgi:hypothetical protein
MCDDCREERRIERQRLRNKGYKKKMIGRGSLMVIYDPDREYGYSIGAIFDGESVKAMLAPFASGFTPGTKLRNCRGEIFVVKRKSTGGAILVLLDTIISQAVV